MVIITKLVSEFYCNIGQLRSDRYWPPNDTISGLGIKKKIVTILRLDTKIQSQVGKF